MEQQETIRIIGDASAHSDMDTRKHHNFNRTFQGLGGFSLITAGILAGVALSFRPDASVPGNILLASWYPVHIALLVSFSLSVLGIIGIFSFLKHEVTPLNQVAFVAGIIGSILSVSIVVIEIFVLPGIYAKEQIEMPMMDMMAIGSSLAALKPFFFIAVIAWVLGWVLIGIALIMSDKLPKYVGYMMIGSILLMAVVPMMAGGQVSSILHMLFALVFGASWVLLGNCIRKYETPF
jgi:hypothetical protein